LGILVDTLVGTLLGKVGKLPVGSKVCMLDNQVCMLELGSMGSHRMGCMGRSWGHMGYSSERKDRSLVHMGMGCSLEHMDHNLVRMVRMGLGHKVHSLVRMGHIRHMDYTSHRNICYS
jgi:hypothetical protein